MKNLSDEQLRNIPIYITSKSLFIGQHTMHIPTEKYHFTSEEARKESPLAVRETYMVLEKYPQLVKEIQRIKPKKIIYTVKVEKEKDFRATEGEGYVGIKRGYFPTQEWLPHYARTIVHELKHMEEERKGNIPEHIYDEDFEKYHEQPWEIKARRYAKKIIPYNTSWKLIYRR